MEQLLDPEQLIRSVGYVGVFLIVFAESGLFFGFFLPGDTLLLTAGLLSSRGFLNLFILLPVLFIGAALGDNVGYWFGLKTGPRIFNRPNSLLFRRQNLLKAKEFYEKHGGKTIVLARFMPLIRTFAPIVAGAVEMDYKRFVSYNLIGALLWAVGVTLIGYALGETLPGIDKYFTYIILAVMFFSALPAMIHLWRSEGPAIRVALQKRFGAARSSE